MSCLQTQCLNHVLLAKRPDIDQKMPDLLRHRHFEKNLLSCIIEAMTNVKTPNPKVLKTGTADDGKKVDENDYVMADVESTSKQFLPFSATCFHIYFIIESMHQGHFLY